MKETTYRISHKGLPDEVKKWLPKKTNTSAAYLIFPFKPTPKKSEELFKGFDNIPMYRIRTSLNFKINEKLVYEFMFVEEYCYSTITHETLWSRKYDTYQYYLNANN